MKKENGKLKSQIKFSYKVTKKFSGTNKVIAKQFDLNTYIHTYVVLSVILKNQLMIYKRP